jgi:hypothetical protein
MGKEEIKKNILSQEVFMKSSKILDYKDPSEYIKKNNSKFVYVNPKIYSKFTINFIPSNGIILTKEGEYVFSQNIYWKPKENAIAIIINSENIKLNMCNYSLVCENSIDNKTIGIKVNGEKDMIINNVSIVNGKIVGISNYGIQSFYCENLHIENITVDKLKLYDLNIRYLTPSGIFLQYINNFTILKVIVENIDVKTDSSAGIQIIECMNGHIESCIMKNFINRDGGVQGYSYIGCENIITTKSKSQNLTSRFEGNILTSGHTVLGFCPILCANLLYKKCSVKNLTGCCDDVHGISIFINLYIEIIKVKIKNIVDGMTITKTGAKSTGIEVYGVNIIIKKCKVSNIFAIRPQDKQCAGFSCAGNKIKYIDCFASNIMVLNKNIIPNSKYGEGVGYGWAPDPRKELNMIIATNVLYKKCKAQKCQVGFDSWFHVNCKWNYINIENCDKPIKKNKNEIRTIKCNKCSECNPPMSVTLYNVEKNNLFSHVNIIKKVIHTYY